MKHDRSDQIFIKKGSGGSALNTHTVTKQEMLGTAIAGTFGYLDLHPGNVFKFWNLGENFLDLKFSQFQPIDLIDSRCTEATQQVLRNQTENFQR